ncbi:K(+)-transporting ATPase subunit C [Frigoribacterium faeni]|uniref:Potassium-transporting ATPase KdpC subunit n=1 Tax=Frigoribacterium faeni TaxID=145483 RepID=A0A7W3JJ55_9MICO|nr:K(+)-transporting ATPase subunit C [Frigoribacterium faeni]MBA8813798.1 K+-transporting ATPase ATPase C chain [Frigoribacterium faeni]GEK82229.1 potassium-transporting ATPase KdpC subunit [Frigoribacterium faeni]
MNLRSTLRQHGVALRAMVVFTVVLGLLYTAVITGIGQLVVPARADGSAVEADGDVVGSSLIGQSFTDADGAALPEWFQSRPSAAGDGYDAAASSGSNHGPENEDLIEAVQERRAAVAESDGVDPASVPVDALTASGSGLDPHISPAYALEQVDRVATARGLSASDVESLVDEHTQGRDLGYLGEPTVNVLELNAALAERGR